MNLCGVLSFALLSLVVTTFTLTTSAVVPTTADFYLEVTIVTGEHSRDSNSITRTLTISSGELTYKETYEGARSRLHPAVKKQFKLTKQDQLDLIAMLKAKNLLITRTISKPPTQKGSTRYFDLAITSALEGKEHSVAIEASPSAADLKADSLYQGSASLLEQLYRIINRTDPDVTIPSLID
jgi:hypothetical protein